jgi:radical SAM protein with 4Fe4S-binding SPASM domain
MTKRKLQKVVKRFRNLPRGFDLVLYIKNKLYSFLLTQIKSSKVAYPSTVMIEVTNHCNLKCITCPREYDYGNEMDKGYIHIENLKNIVDEIYPYIDSIGLTGLGETFLYKELEAAIDYIRKKSKGIIISCSINAHLKNSVEIAGKLINKIDTIQISIDGIGDVYNKVRVNSDYDFFINNLKQIAALAKNSQTDVMFNMVAIKENYHQMSKIAELAGSLDIKYLNIVPINLVSVTDIDSSYYNFFKSEEFIKEYNKCKKTASEYSIEFTSFNLNSNNSFKNCRFIWNYFYITWDGFLTPCCAKPFPKEKNFGNVFENGFYNSLNSIDYQKFRKLWYLDKKPAFCNKCFYVDFN